MCDIVSRDIDDEEYSYCYHQNDSGSDPRNVFYFGFEQSKRTYLDQTQVAIAFHRDGKR